MHSTALITAWLLGAVAGCSSNTAPEQLPPTRDAKVTTTSVRTTSTSEAAVSGTTVPGYTHNFASSRFAIGSGVQNVNAGDRAKVVGSNGTFATLSANGAVFASLNARSPLAQTLPWADSAAAHNALVVQYFTGAGLPSNQVGVTSISSSIGGGGVGGQTPTQVFYGYDSSIIRTVQGIIVVESVAHAEFNSNGDVVSEGVYWPALPQSVFDDARAISSMVSDSVAGPAFIARLPATPTNGRVVVRHSGATYPTTFVAFGCYEGLFGTTWRHFDINANELKLPYEG